MLDNVLVLIDTRSFSSVWYWIALAVTWSTVSHFTLGVPQDLIARARRHGGQAAADAEAMAHIHARRRLSVMRSAGHWVTCFVAAALTLLLVLGFGYGVEIAQALFLLMFPLSLTGIMSLRAAARIEVFNEYGPALWQRLARLRFWTQVTGMLAIFVTSMWGMWRILTTSVLGG